MIWQHSTTFFQTSWETVTNIKKELLNLKATYTYQSLRVLNWYGKITADTSISDANATSSSSSVTQQDGTSSAISHINEENARYQQAASHHDDQEDEDDGASRRNIKELLFAMGYKKFKGKDRNLKNKASLDEVGGDNPF